MPAAKVILRSSEVDGLIDQLSGKMAAEIGSSGEDWALVGIRTGGEKLAGLLRDRLRARGLDLPLGILDITFYRDDLARAGGSSQPTVRKTEIDFGLDGKSVFLVDDVLYTGRTVRAAMDELMDFGRPDRIRLAVLIDRGGREIPIQADIVGKRVEAPPDFRVTARFDGPDGPQVTME